jgi:hypothetical protein
MTRSYYSLLTVPPLHSINAIMDGEMYEANMGVYAHWGYSADIADTITYFYSDIPRLHVDCEM